MKPRSLVTLTLAYVAVCAILTSTSAHDQQGLSPKVAETVLQMRVAEVAIKHAHSTLGLGCEPEEGSGVRTLATSPYNEMPEVAEDLPKSDAWGSPLRYWTDCDRVVLISPGPDRALDDAYLEPGRSLRVLESYVDDVIWSAGRLVAGGPHTLFRPAMADLRSIAASIEEYSIDHNEYPGPTPGLVPVEIFEADLAPIYIRQLPLKDPWGSPFRVWSDRKSYLLVSAGPDRRVDRDYLPLELDSKGRPVMVGAIDPEPERDDVVFVRGMFIQWPRGQE